MVCGRSPERAAASQSLPGSGCRALAGLEGASAITISPDGRFVYVASELSGAVRGFLRNRSTGALKPLYGHGGCISSGKRGGPRRAPAPSTVPQLAGARSIALSPDGRELYVAAFDPGAVVVLQTRSPQRGARRAASQLPAGGARRAAARWGFPFCTARRRWRWGRTARVVYVISEGANSLVELLRSPTDGALTLASEIPTGMDPLSGPVGARALAERAGHLRGVALRRRGGGAYGLGGGGMSRCGWRYVCDSAAARLNARAEWAMTDV